MNLDEAQRKQVASWVAEGLKLSETQNRLASELGVQHGTAESWLKGWRKPHYRHLPRIVETLEIDELTIYRWLTEDEETRENSGSRVLRPMGLLTHTVFADAA